MTSLLPSDHSEFRSKQYWNDFFVKRQATTGAAGEAASTFEWYGEWSDVQEIVAAYVPPVAADVSVPGAVAIDHTLVIGCGNSTTSEEMFAQGYRCVTSIDFSDIVIAEMRKKTQGVVSAEDADTAWLRFEKMDMLNMTFEDASFNMVFDKGALDALMSDETKRSAKDAAKMFKEIDRVAGPRGTYVCVTLAQKHIMAALFRHFAAPGSGWTLHIHGYSTKIGSALCPFVFVAVRNAPVAVGSVPASSIVTHFGDSTSTMFGGEGNVATMGQAIRRVIGMQQTHNFLGGPVKPGCCITLYLWPQHAKEEKAAASLARSGSNGARFTVTVIDPEYDPEATGKLHPPNGRLSCGVFIVPRGREHEFLFSQVEGQESLAQQAGYARLIIVALERGHDFSGGLEAVKTELDAYVTKLSPPSSSPAQIPYLTVGGPDSLGSRIQVFSGESELSGPYTVEDVIVDAGTKQERAVRRLVFLDNPHTVQSEVSLVKSVGSISSKKKKKSKKSKKPSKSKKPKSNGIGGGSGAGDEPSFSSRQGSLEQVIDNGMIAKHDNLAFEFHAAMACSLGLLNSSAIQKRGGNVKVLVVGLGGGCLPMFIHDHFQNAHVSAVELDPEIVSIATRCFGFNKNSARMAVTVGDGIKYVNDMATMEGDDNTFDVVVFDVDAKDGLSTGVSFPPAAFLEDAFVRSVHSNVLSDDGILCINVASRSESMFKKTLQNLGGIFAVIDIVKYEDSLNRIIFAHKAETLDERKWDSLAAADQRDADAHAGPRPLTPEAVLRRLKSRATQAWPENTDEELLDAMRDARSQSFLKRR